MERKATTTPAPPPAAPVRALTPARALTSAVPPPAAPAVQRRATPAAVPLRRPGPALDRPEPTGAGPAVQRSAALGARPAAQRLTAAGPTPTTPAPSPTPFAGRPAPMSQAPTRPRAPRVPAVVQRHASGAAAAAPAHTAATTTDAAAPTPALTSAPVPVQRDPKNPLLPTPAVAPVTASRTTSGGSGSSASGSTGDPPGRDTAAGELPPAYTPVAKGQFDPRSLTDFQLDELTHKLIGRITRLIRTELRLDRERIGKLRDPRR
ncbi:extensin [Streptomyces sp. NPDC056437]|uniref:extensin n=1 Tax=Streptomyces sp. NPDC056437 TaxID=3345816 RepID=UPI003693FE9A